MKTTMAISRRHLIRVVSFGVALIIGGLLGSTHISRIATRSARSYAQSNSFTTGNAVQSLLVAKLQHIEAMDGISAVNVEMRERFTALDVAERERVLASLELRTVEVHKHSEKDHPDVSSQARTDIAKHAARERFANLAKRLKQRDDDHHLR